MARKWRALLIQDVLEYSEILRPLIVRCIFQNQFHIQPSEVLEWIIREEIAQIYCLFDSRHIRQDHPCSQVYYYVQQHVKYDLSVMTAQHIKGPPLYGDNCQVEIWLKGRDLYIGYNK